MACLKGINKNKRKAIDRAISMTSLEEKKKVEDKDPFWRTKVKSGYCSGNTQQS